MGENTAEMKNTISEMENTLDGNKNRLDEAEEWLNDLEASKKHSIRATTAKTTTFNWN